MFVCRCASTTKTSIRYGRDPSPAASSAWVWAQWGSAPSASSTSPMQSSRRLATRTPTLQTPTVCCGRTLRRKLRQVRHPLLEFMMFLCARQKDVNLKVCVRNWVLCLAERHKQSFIFTLLPVYYFHVSIGNISHLARFDDINRTLGYQVKICHFVQFFFFEGCIQILKVQNIFVECTINVQELLLCIIAYLEVFGST